MKSSIRLFRYCLIQLLDTLQCQNIFSDLDNFDPSIFYFLFNTAPAKELWSIYLTILDLCNLVDVEIVQSQKSYFSIEIGIKTFQLKQTIAINSDENFIQSTSRLKEILKEENRLPSPEELIAIKIGEYLANNIDLIQNSVNSHNLLSCEFIDISYKKNSYLITV